MLPPSGIPPEITDAWTTPGAWLMRSTICANAARRSGGGFPGSDARRDLRRQHAFRVEARIDAHQRDEAADEERRADEQHDGQRDFGDDERAAQPLARRRRRSRRARHPSARCVRSGLDSCSAGTMPKRSPVRSDRPAAAASTRRSSAIVGDARHALGHRAPEDLDRPPREHDREHRPDDREHEALDHELADSRQRPAPSAARMPTSRSRALARASSRFATFAHAISSTMPTAPSSISIHDFVRAPTR